MRLFLFLHFALVMTLHAAEPVSLAGAMQRSDVGVTLGSSLPLAITIKNRSGAPLTIVQPAGLICRATGSEARIVTLRALEVTVAANSTADLTVPAAILRAGASSGAFSLTAEAEPRMEPLLAYLAGHNGVPRTTAQLLVRCVIDDIGFATWQHSLRLEPGAEPASEEIVAAVDALGILRAIQPEGRFALAADPALKLRALRNPVARRKAMQFYGIDLPEAPLPPELGTLLHTKPGDNCPICRQRTLMQPREDGL